MAGVLEYYRQAMVKYASFEGRVGRQPFFGYVVALSIILILAAFVDTQISGRIGTLFAIAVLGHVLPSLAISVRRLHDIDSPGGLLLIAILPYVGWAILAICALAPSDPASNKYGPLLPPRVAAKADLRSTIWYRLGHGIALIRQRFLEKPLWPPQEEINASLPESSEGLAAELGSNSPGSAAGKPFASARLQHLQSLRASRMISEAEFIRLSRGESE